MSCERALPLLYDLVDGDVERADAIWLTGHVASCAGCAGLLTELRAAESAYAQAIPVAPPAGLAARIADAVWEAAPERAPGWSWEPAAVFVLLAALIAAALLAPDLGGSTGILARAAAVFPRVSPGALPTLGRAIAAAAREAASRLPGSAAGIGWTPLAAVAVALQIAGSAWLLSGRRAVRPEAR